MSQTEGERWIKAGENDWLAAQHSLLMGIFIYALFMLNKPPKKA